MLERTGLPAALAALIIAAASAANADPEMAAATPPVATAPKADVRVAPAADKADAAASEPDDEDSQAEVDKSAAELEAVRKAEEKAGLLPQAPGAGPRDGLSVGLDPADPLARDLATALGLASTARRRPIRGRRAARRSRCRSFSAFPRKSCGRSTTSRSS